VRQRKLGQVTLVGTLIVAAALIGGCGGSAAVAPPLVHVALGIYSGRLDPTWTLTPGEAAQLESLVMGLPHRLGIPRQGGLGYHGFIVDVPIGFGGEGAARTLVTFEGEVAESGLGSRPIGIDQRRSVERFLLETGRSRLGNGEVSVVEGDLASR
jgi:hypothetical protein